MAQVVMLTALAGDGCDIVAGDVCECDDAQARRFLAFGYARELGKGDQDRPVKPLVAKVPNATNVNIEDTLADKGTDAGQAEATKAKPRRAAKGKKNDGANRGDQAGQETD